MLQRAGRHRLGAEEAVADNLEVKDVEHQLSAMSIGTAMHGVHAEAASATLGGARGSAEAPKERGSKTKQTSSASFSSSSAAAAAPSQAQNRAQAAQTLPASSSCAPTGSSTTRAAAMPATTLPPAGSAPSPGIFPDGARFKLFAFDIETTGLKKDTARIIEIALVELPPLAPDEATPRPVEASSFEATPDEAIVLVNQSSGSLAAATSSQISQPTYVATSSSTTRMCGATAGNNNIAAANHTSMGVSAAAAAGTRSRVSWSTLVNPGVPFRKGVSGGCHQLYPCKIH